MRRLWIPPRHTGWLPVAVGVVAVIGLLWLVVVLAPPWFVDDDTLEGLKAQNDVRTTLLQGLGGVVLLAGAYFTYRQLHTAREGQITERYTRAIDQLGHAELDVRLGGIYALERIARDSPADRRTIGEVLCAFVRSHAPWPPHLPTEYPEDAALDDVPELLTRAPDVAASLAVLGRGGFAKAGDDRLNLSAVDLRHASLWFGGHLEGVYLADAHLEGAYLIGADLKDAILLGTHLEGADLAGTNLKGAYLTDAHLEGAYLTDAHLEGAYLIGADLKGAYLAGTNLEGADLAGTNLEGADLIGADLKGAEADQRTRWPAGFDWRAAGVGVAGEDSAAGPSVGAG